MSSSAPSESLSLLVINPNSSQVVTDGLEQNLSSYLPPGVRVTYFTGPPEAPPSINDEATSVQSTEACLRVLKDEAFTRFDGYLICCFSDHPLTFELKRLYDKPVLNILHASLAQGLLLGSRIGIITTGPAWVEPLMKGAVEFLGGDKRFVGVEATGLGVVELKTDGEGHVDEQVKNASVRIARKGADVIILGCAGMTGMDPLVKSSVTEAGLHAVDVVDGAKAGAELLTGLARQAMRAGLE